MIRRPLYALFLCIILLCSSAANTHGKDSCGKSFLWQVRSQTATAYVLGSIHLMKRESYPLNSKIETAFDKAGTLVVEADINKITQNDLGALLTKAIYFGGDSLDRHVSKATCDLVKKEANRLGMDPDLFLKQKPWLLANSIEVIELMRMGFDPNYGIDEHFLMEAAGRKKIVELESIESQLDLLAGFSDSEQDALLYSTIKSINKIEQIMSRLIAAWNVGDTKTIEALIFEDSESDPKLLLINDKLITERNRAMALKMEGMLKTSGSYFIVVGAGHLIGDKGVIALLRKKGYAVEQL